MVPKDGCDHVQYSRSHETLGRIPGTMRQTLTSLVTFCLLFLATCSTPVHGQDLQWMIDMEEQAKDASRRGRYAEAEQLAATIVARAERTYGRQDGRYGGALSIQSGILAEAGKNIEAMQAARQAIAIMSADADLGPMHLTVALGLQNLGLAQLNLRQYADAEATYRRTLAIFERLDGDMTSGIGQSLNNLGVALDESGRYLESGELFKRALAMRIKAHGGVSWPVAETAFNIGIHYKDQRRYDEAEAYLDYAIKVHERVFGRTNPKVAGALSILAVCQGNTGRKKEAEASLKEVLAIEQKLNGKPLSLMHAEYALAEFYLTQDRLDEAEPVFHRALKFFEALQDEYKVAGVHYCLAKLRNKQNRLPESETHFAESEKRYRAADNAKNDLYELHRLRAAFRGVAERWQDAAADIEQAMRLAEEIRNQVSGGAADRAHSFEFYNMAFPLAAYIYFKLGDTAQALSAAERGVARSLIDDIEAQRVNLLAGVPVPQAQALRNEFSDAESKVADLEHKLETLERQLDVSDADRQRRQNALLAEMAAARERLVNAHVAIQNASPAYRRAVAQKLDPVALDKLQAWLKSHKTLMLYYLAASPDVGVLLVTLGGEKDCQIHELELSLEQAKVLGVEIPQESKPEESLSLTGTYLDNSLNALLPRLADVKRNAEATPALATLWEVLIPKDQREALLAGKYERLIVVPSGAIGLLPFEALVTNTQPEPAYFIDSAPPVTYVPSATILFKLMERQAVPPATGRNPVLTVGGVAYGQTGERPEEVRGQSPLRSRYGALGGQLNPLPFTGWESSWVKEAFTKQGIGVSELSGSKATEAAFRLNAPGRSILHVACHGLADQTYGNFFGALALTRGQQGSANSQDDGFLTLAEIYELDLHGNELAILSACQTNFGPKQQGEGVWALTRGFLVAGSKRVVATNWVVDDEASATLVNFLAQFVATTQKNNNGMSYAQALQKARQAIRKDGRWRSPFYWAPFVLVGPGE